MAASKKTLTSTSSSVTPTVGSAPDTSELESRVQALEEKVVDLIKRLERKLSF